MQLQNHSLFSRDEKNRNLTVSSAYLTDDRRCFEGGSLRFDGGGLKGAGDIACLEGFSLVAEASSSLA